ncbi:MAG: hypothetical protein NVS2B16_24420 [Chloroflexota bacterium]
MGIPAETSQTEQIDSELREQAEQYRSIFECSVDGILISDLDGYIVEANPAACRMYGYAHDEFIGLHGTALLDADSLPIMQETLETVKKGGSVRRAALAVRKAGTAFSVEGPSTPFTFRGKPHIMSVVRDVSEQIEAAEQVRQRQEEYRAIFEATSDGLIVADLDGRLVEVNPALCRMHGYSRDELVRLYPTDFIHPDYHSIFAEYMATLNRGGTYQTGAIDVRKDGSTFPVEVHGTTFVYRGTPHVLGVVRDVSERAEAERQLREREEQYRGIFETTSDGLIIGDIDGFVVEVNPAACRMYGYSHDEFIGRPISSLVHPDYRDESPENRQTIDEGGVVQVQEIALRRDGTPFYVDVQGSRFIYKGRPHRLAAVRDVTERVRIHDMLEQRVEERTRELSTLLDVSHHVASTLQLQPLLDLIIDQLKSVVDYTGAGISLEQGPHAMKVIAYRGPGPQSIALGAQYEGAVSRPLWELMRRGVPMVIDDVRGDTPFARMYRDTVGDLLEAAFNYIRSWMAIPLRVKDRDIGVLFLEHDEPNAYTAHHADLALALAQQAAIAIDNARLHERAREAAVLEERQRLSRELHDSVTQALYGIGVGAQTTRLMLEKDPGRAAESNDYVISLARAGMAEMRALIFELRPESLEMEGLAAALRKQASALQARHEIPVTVSLCAEPQTPLIMKEALYRIAQEALHNVVKHARATQVFIALVCRDGEIGLEIEDNGAGFDTDEPFPGHLGLQSMRERATSLGGTLETNSRPGEGTKIRASIPLESRP